MQHAWHGKGEGRNWRFELGTVFCRHLITALHHAHGRRQYGTTGILKMLARLQQGLHPYHTQPAYFLNVLIGIGNDPMTADQLRSNVAVIGDGDGLRKYNTALIFIGLIRHKRCFDRDRKLILFMRRHR
jgi:hypothetical protein